MTDIHAGLLQKEASIQEKDRFSFLNRKRFRILLLVIGAVVMALCTVTSDLSLLQWFGMIPAGLVILRLTDDTSMRLRTYYAYGLIYFWAFYIVIFHWFVAMYPLSFTGLSPTGAAAVVLAGVFGLSLLQAFFSAWIFVLYGLTSRSKWSLRLPFLRPFLFSALYVLAEWFQNFGWWGVPWGRLPIGQSGMLWMLQTAEWFGSYWITFLLVSVNLCFAYAILNVTLRRLSILTACGILTVNTACGAVLYYADRDTGEPFRVAAIQGNITNKWDRDTLESTQEVYRAYTLVAAAEGADLIIWPETALPYDMTLSPTVMRFVCNLAKETETMILFGAFRSLTLETEEDVDYNSLFLVLPDGTVHDTVYDKHQLVPFGEFIPLKNILTTIYPPLTEVAMLEEDLSRGELGKNMETAYGSLGGMICFDSIYERVALSAVQNGAQLLCLSSNDAWFLDSAAIYMHHNQAKLRAIETGRYLVRSGNSGITSVIRPNGEVLTEIKPLIDGYVISDVYFRSDRTLYSYIGNTFVYLLLGGVAILSAERIYELISDRIKRKHSESL
jgi:apolipoprotein N-acyltransferase